MRSAALLLFSMLSQQSFCSSPPRPSPSFVHFEIPQRPDHSGRKNPWYASDHVLEPLPTELPRGILINHCAVEGVTALTFDDGPYIYTSHVLDLLDEWDVKATFFINGNNWSNNIDDESGPWPALLRRMDEAGHQIGSHGWSHTDMSKVDSETRYQELHDLEVAIFHVLGKIPSYFRPPFGSCDAECLAQAEEMGYHVVRWDTDVHDWDHNSPETIGEAKRIFYSGTKPLYV